MNVHTYFTKEDQATSFLNKLKFMNSHDSFSWMLVWKSEVKTILALERNIERVVVILAKHEQPKRIK